VQRLEQVEQEAPVDLDLDGNYEGAQEQEASVDNDQFLVIGNSYKNKKMRSDSAAFEAKAQQQADEIVRLRRAEVNAQQRIREAEVAVAVQQQAVEITRLHAEATAQKQVREAELKAQQQIREQADEIAQLRAETKTQQQIREAEMKAQQQQHIREAEMGAQRQAETNARLQSASKQQDQVEEMTTLLTKSNESLTSLSRVLVDRIPKGVMQQPHIQSFPRITQSLGRPSSTLHRLRTANPKPSKANSQPKERKVARLGVYQTPQPRRPAGGVGN
jgi:hypothetical protein